jgi:2-oxoglutarate dehydrogenase E2 component (dihydrolipoamide succinyltransferase)
MADIVTPALGESVTEATIARWTKKVGDPVKKDEVIVELDTDKVSLEVSAPEDGVLTAIGAEEGATVGPGQVLGQVSASGQAAAAPAKAAKPAKSATAAPPEPAPQAAAPAAQPAPAPAAAAGGGSTTIDITVPVMGESVTEGQVGRWLKNIGESVKRDEVLIEIETEKVALEVPAPADGVITELLVNDSDTVGPGQVIARMSTGAGAAAPAQASSAAQPAAAPQAASAPAMPLSPSVQRITAENNLDPAAIPGTGREGRITKGDALAALEARAAQAQAAPAVQVAAAPRPEHAREERVRMTRLRQTIARRLKEAQNTAAMLTTFNEVDMSGVMALRNAYKDQFEKTHGVKLGFMGFFVRAAIHALKAVPAVNAEIDGTDLVYKNHYDIGVAVGTDRGLVVPVVRDADQMSLAQIEKTIGDLGKQARDGTLSLDQLQGGTFTISNGGVYGSLMSTPILNAPQSGILGMHKIQDRPMVVGGQIVARPMMYLALSYDHRIVDGKEAVTFLVRLKEAVEEPQRLLLDV